MVSEPQAHHTILFTTLPDGITLNKTPLPVSVLVSPRLQGPDHLGAYPDWLKWTGLLKEHGAKITFTCAGQSLTLPLNTAPLQPEYWTDLFKEDTLVRSFQYTDMTEKAVLSYSVRLAMSSLKALYQEAGFALALPAGDVDDQERSRLRLLGDMLAGLQVNWDEREAPALRQQLAYRLKDGAGSSNFSAQMTYIPPAFYGPDGLLSSQQIGAPGSSAREAFNAATALPFAAFHHMPPAPPIETPDWDTALDFHQALSALNAYRELQRALGLVFDLELPADFVAQSGFLNPETLAVTAFEPGWGWEIQPEPLHALHTAYYHLAAGETRLFLTALHPQGFQKTGLQVLGLLNLDAGRFGLAQIDMDGGMHKTIQLAESALKQPAPPNPEVYDPTTSLPALRSGGLSLFADQRALGMLNQVSESKSFNDALEAKTGQPRPFYAEDLVRGFRIDIWEARTGKWQSLHRRNGTYVFSEHTFETEDEEGFVQLAVTQAAPDPEREFPAEELYLHEAIARWPGWSMSAPMPGKHLTRHADPEKAVPPDPGDPEHDPENPAITPFKMAPTYKAVPGSLPRLRFGESYRLRVRVVDLAGNALRWDDPLAVVLANSLGLPKYPEGLPYLRFEPLPSPQIVLRDERGVTGPGSAVDRIVIRTYNDDPSKDGDPANLTANDRHIAPPRATIDLAEKMGMFDDASGKPIAGPAMYNLISARDTGDFQQTPNPVDVSGLEQTFPLEPDPQIDSLPYLPDGMARAAVIRDLPGTPEGCRGRAEPGAGAAAAVEYQELDDPNPRPGSATLISFGGNGWQGLQPFRLALEEGDAIPQWDPAGRLLTVYLPKGASTAVPLSSWLSPSDLKRMGPWAWLRQYLELDTIFNAHRVQFFPGSPVERIAHLLQRAVEGGHWMLTPPRVLHLVHAVQQPIGQPAFTPLVVQRQELALYPLPDPLETMPEKDPTQETEHAALTAWRRPDGLDAYLLGGLRIHGASTIRVDLEATWEDPVDDPASGPPSTIQLSAQVDELPLPRLRDEWLVASGLPSRQVGFYDLESDTIAFLARGDAIGSFGEGLYAYIDSAPRHKLGDTRHHRISYTPVATSRYREYFPADAAVLDFTRRGAPLEVNVPASARPDTPARVLRAAHLWLAAPERNQPEAQCALWRRAAGLS